MGSPGQRPRDGLVSPSAEERKSATTVAPYLVVADPQRVIDFLTAVFDATPLRHCENEGRIVHAEVRIGDSVIMLGDSGGGTTTPCHVHVYVENVDETFLRAVAAGGTTVQPPMKKGDNDKRGGISGPSGAVTWWIGT